jgi:hypothetical protein
LEANPRNADATILSRHDIPDNPIPTPIENVEAFYDNTLRPTWHENNGVNIIGTPLGSPTLVKDYLHKKLKKHSLLYFLIDVAKMSFPRKAHKMFTSFVVPRLIHISKSTHKDLASVEWMKSADDAVLSTW